LLLLPLLTAFAQADGRPSVFVDSEPLGSRILLDGQLLAERTPVLLRGLKPGNHTISLWHEGFHKKDQTLVLTEDKVPVVEVALAPDSAVLAFPANSQVTDPEGSHPTDGKQFRYPAGTYQVLGADAVTFTPVFPDEGLLTAAGWGLVVLSGAAALATVSDIYHVSTRWVDHPSEITAALWVSALFELPWYGALAGRKARFLRDSAPQITALPERLDQAKTLFDDGESALQSGELAQAETLLSRLVKEFPESQLVPGAWFRLARIHSVTGRKNLALGEYRLVAETYPQAAYHDRARKALADLYEASGEPVKAIENLDKMVLTDDFFDKADIEVQKVRLVAAQGVKDAP
jgi:hypothetical protein